MKLTLKKGSRPDGRIRLILAGLTLLMMLVATGCSSDDPPLSIIGNYTDPWGGTHEITALTWTATYGTSPSVYHIQYYLNESEYLVAQNDSLNTFNPDLFSRFDWTTFGGSLYYCQSAYDKLTAGEANAEATADRTDPTAGGCGVSSFTWDLLTPF